MILTGCGIAAVVAKQHEDSDQVSRAIDRMGVDVLVDFGNEFGDGLPLGVAAAGLYLSGRTFGGEGSASLGSDMARSLLWSSAVVWSLKIAVNAERPDGGAYSFPSGHTASAFAVAPIIAHHWGWTAGVGAFTLATATALGRMEDRRHHLSDVLFGAAIGMAIGYEVARGDEDGIIGGLRKVLGPLSVSSQGLALSMSF